MDRHRTIGSVFVILMFLLQGCASCRRGTPKTVRGPLGVERLHATLWVQSSAEYRALCRTIYRQAGTALDRALADNSISAAIEQKAGYQHLPPAVILDIDETVLNNALFQGRLIRGQRDYNSAIWKKWSVLAEAPPVPGAVEFLNYAVSRGVTPIFISNRLWDEEADTVRNLHRIGLTGATSKTVLLKKEKGHPEWTSDKSSRRAFAARRFRILLLVGDDLNDFVSVKGLDVTGRDRVASRCNQRFGREWFLLPNPQYGSWEAAVLGGSYLRDAGKSFQVKFNTVKGFGTTEKE